MHSGVQDNCTINLGKIPLTCDSNYNPIDEGLIDIAEDPCYLLANGQIYLEHYITHCTLVHSMQLNKAYSINTSCNQAVTDSAMRSRISWAQCPMARLTTTSSLAWCPLMLPAVEAVEAWPVPTSSAAC